MVLIQKKCERILSEFKDEILTDLEEVRDLDADGLLEQLLEIDVSYYAKRIHDELEAEFDDRAVFTKYAENSCEESVISALFLNLYRLDASALRKDLYSLPRRAFVQATAAQRKDLFWLLYHTISLYTGGKPSLLTEAYTRCIGRQAGCGTADRYKPALSAFVREVCYHEKHDHKDFDFSPYIQDLLLAVSADVWSDDFEFTREGKVLVTLLLNLYGQDDSVLRNELKIIETASLKSRMLYAARAVDSNRDELLLILYHALFSYIEQDLSWLIAACDRVEAMR